MTKASREMLPHSALTELKCPTCGNVAAAPSNANRKSPRPFCSSRCAKVDLGRWFQEQYAIPAVDSEYDTIADDMIGEMAAGLSKE